MVFEGCCMS